MMNRYALTAALLLTGGAAMAQGPEGFGGPPPGAFGGPGGRRERAPRAVTAASIPLRTLASYLSLTDAQTGKIALIREEAQEALRPAMPRQREAGSGADSGRQAAETKASREIKAVLNESQRTRLTALMKAIQTLQSAGVRPDAVTKLQLTDEQLAGLAAGRGVDEVLNERQIEIAQSYRVPPFGGPGGFPGGPPPEGFGGPGGPPPGGEGG